MDLGALLLPLDEQPATIGRHACLLPGAHMPIVVPLDGLPAANLRAWVLQAESSPLAARLQAAFALDADLAWRLLDARPPGRRLDLASDLIIGAWLAQALAAYPDVDPSAAFASLPTGDTDLARAGRRAYAAVRSSFTALGEPPWRGPLLLIGADQDPVEALDPGTIRSRPVLPQARMPASAATDTEHLADAAAELITAIFLERLRRGGPDWPDWLQSGLSGVAAERLRGRGPSPRGMWRQRREAGLATLLAIVRGERQADRRLATALVAPLVHTRRRDDLPSFLDLLRNGIAPVQALSTAYGLSVQELIDRP